ncbi:cellulase family glycosylhydrolase [Teredinibacter turnerae]|uniref:cellulase family glycosylhydrolase n=1 Tax=Teredinibacter turnerae TaxID=2426 RepID=UPI00036785A6|nr:cellulase family glycosylhydrolase [Teredinibacter turnerae]
MKLRLNYFALAFGALMLTGCGGSGLAGSSDDVDPLTPEIEDEFVPSGPQPSENAKVITSSDGSLYDVSGKPILLRGVNLQYADNPSSRLAGVASIRDVGSNVVRLMLSTSTSAAELAAALDSAVANDLVVMLSLDNADTIACQDDADYLIDTATQLWLTDWVSVLAQDKYQSHLMVNIANEWGPMNIFNANSIGYDEYIDTYKILVRRFRDAGFKFPLVIDAPHCGRDFSAFLGGRGRELLASDTQENIVLAAHAFGSRWNSRDEISYAAGQLAKEKLPFVISEFGGSGVYGDGSIDHKELMNVAQGETALAVDLPWFGTDDTVTYGHTFDSPLDFSQGSGMDFEIYVPANYQADGKLMLQAVLIDSNGKKATRIFGTAAQLIPETWTEVNVQIADTEDLHNIEDGFMLDSVLKVGFQVSANGKSPEVVGAIQFDNLKVGLADGGNSDAIYSANFDSGLGGWGFSYGTGSSASVSLQDGALALLAPWSASSTSTQIGYPGIVNNSPAVDLTQPMTLSVDVFIPEEYAAETGMNMQFFFNGYGWNGYAGVGYTTISAFTPGEWNTLSVQVTSLANDSGSISGGFPVDQPPQQVGIEVGGITSAKTQPLLFDNFSIVPPPEAQVVTLYESNFEFNDGWNYSFGLGDASSVTVTDGALAVLPPWENYDPTVQNNRQIALAYTSAASLRPSIDFSQTMTLRMDIFVPESYRNTGMNVQFWFGANDYSGFASIGYRSASNGLLFGEWQTMEVTFDNVSEPTFGYVSEGFITDRPPRQVGVQITDVKTQQSEPILIDNFTLERVGGPAVPSNVVLDIPFSTQAEVDAFQVLDFGGSSFTESVLNDAKSLSYALDPFGWIAWSWIGSTEGEGDTVGILDLSTEVDSATSLTGRGEEIIYGDDGIANTGDDVSF